MAAADRHGWVPGGVAVAGVCKQPGELGFGVCGSDVCCAGAALRRHPAGTPADSVPRVSWALGRPRWPPPIATVGSHPYLRELARSRSCSREIGTPGAWYARSQVIRDKTGL